MQRAIAIGARAACARVPLWAPAAGGRDCITRKIAFTDFKHAWAFMSAIAIEAEASNHHPEWSNVYGTVEIALTTHDAGGVTEKDVSLARAIDDFASKLGGKAAGP
jgi:4a-hydroxytetrahydrobiopterin dehydratase